VESWEDNLKRNTQRLLALSVVLTQPLEAVIRADE
jgi:hypothetical protein